MISNLFLPKDNGHTGKREAAWAILGIAFGFTVADIALSAYLGPENTRDLTALLIVIWPSAIANFGFQYKLENDNKRWKFEKTTIEETPVPPAGFPGGE